MESSRNKATPGLITIDLSVSGVAGLSDAERACARSRVWGFEHLWDPFGEYFYVSQDGLIQASKLLRGRKNLQSWLPDIVPLPLKSIPVTMLKLRAGQLLLIPINAVTFSGPLKRTELGSTWKRFNRWSYVFKEQPEDTDDRQQMHSV